MKEQHSINTKAITFPPETFSQNVVKERVRYKHIRNDKHHARAFMLGTNGFFQFFQNAFSQKLEKNKLINEYTQVHKEMNVTNPRDIDRIDLPALCQTMINLKRLPVPPRTPMSYNYSIINSSQHNGTKILFFLLKVKMNVKIFVSDEEYNNYSLNTNWNKNIIYYPALIQDHGRSQDTKEQLQHQLNWVQDFYGVPQGPALSWLLIFPNSHFYCSKSKASLEKDSKHLPLPYEWLGLGENSANEVCSDKFVSKVINNTLVPFYECYPTIISSNFPHNFVKVTANVTTQHWKKS